MMRSCKGLVAGWRTCQRAAVRAEQTQCAASLLTNGTASHTPGSSQEHNSSCHDSTCSARQQHTTAAPQISTHNRLPTSWSLMQLSCTDTLHHSSCTHSFASSRAFSSGSRGRGMADDDDMPASVADTVAAALRGSRSAKEVLEQRAAREVMADPMSRVLASHGMPLGISMDPLKKGAASAVADTIEVESVTIKPKPEPGFQMEAIDELFDHTKPSGSIASSQAAGDQFGTLADAAASGADKVDSWGTTREGPAEIARRIVQSNIEAEAAEADAAEEVVDSSDDELTLAPGEEKYKTLEQMSADIKGLDEVFEVLASVPWLDEDDLKQKELKGVAMVGLLGTLEEVGFAIRPQVYRIWAGDRDDGMITECEAAKDQAALISILFHTKKIEEEHGAPPKGPVHAQDAGETSSLLNPEQDSK